jgi:hypothetical protein
MPSCSQRFGGPSGWPPSEQSVRLRASEVCNWVWRRWNWCTPRSRTIGRAKCSSPAAAASGGPRQGEIVDFYIPTRSPWIAFICERWDDCRVLCGVRNQNFTGAGARTMCSPCSRPQSALGQRSFTWLAGRRASRSDGCTTWPGSSTRITSLVSSTNISLISFEIGYWMLFAWKFIWVHATEYISNYSCFRRGGPVGIARLLIGLAMSTTQYTILNSSFCL